MGLRLFIRNELKTSLYLAKMGSYKGIKLDFKNNTIESTNDLILLRINLDFDRLFLGRSEHYESFKNKGSFIIKAEVVDILLHHCDIGGDIFKAISNDLDFYEYQNRFPDTDRIRVTNTKAVERITYDVKKVILPAITVCSKLGMAYSSFYFNGSDNPTEIRGETASIILAPYIK